jgi:hypothetical protein
MAAPNIVNVALINANSNNMTLSTTSEIGLLSNPASSGKVYKVNTIMVTNRETNANAVNVTVNVYSAAALTGTGIPIAQLISVPGYSTLVITDKSTAFYLQEDKSIGIKSGTSNGLTVMTSWEEIS